VNILVDTSVWSLAIRRSPDRLDGEQSRIKEEMEALVAEGRVEMIGPIRQELLSGIRQETQFQRVRGYLALFDDAVLTRADYEGAARIHNKCRTAGIAGSAVDFLICAVALRRNWEVFTLDKDFQQYARKIPLALYVPRAIHS